MADNWTINGAAASTLGVSGLAIAYANQTPDRATFTAPAAAIDSSPLFAYKEALVIARGATVFFRGIVLSIPAQGSAAAESVSYEAVGPWWHLEHCIYQQKWKSYDTSLGELTDRDKSRVILCQDADGDRITTGAQILDALNVAIAAGAPISVGTIDADLQIPWEEALDISCAEVIRRMLRLSPDCVCWFDYSSGGAVFHCRRRANLSAVTLSLAGAAGVQDVSITPRYDLQIPGIIIRYEKTHKVGSATYATLEEDTAGDTAQLDTLITTVELSGHSGQLLTQKIVTSDWGGLTDKPFWKANLPWLEAIADADFTVSSATRDTELPRYLTEGNIPDWSTKDAEEDTLTAKIDYTVRDPAGNAVEVKRGREVTVTKTSTNASTGTLRRYEEESAEEPTPVGLAAAIYAAVSTLQYDGALTLVESECTRPLSVGNRLHLSGALTAWATMGAIVQRCRLDIDVGTTQIEFGPPAHLGVDDLLTLLRALRSRKVAYSAPERVSGEPADNQRAVPLGGPAPRNEAGAGGGETTRLVVQGYTGGGTDLTAQIDLDCADMGEADIGKVVQMQPATGDGVPVARLEWPRFHA